MLVLVAAAACGRVRDRGAEPRGETITTGTHTLTTPGGDTRTYYVYVPPALPAATEVPLLIALHGGMGSARQFAEQSGFDALAAQHGFVVAYPEGTDLAGPLGGVWNGGVCCGKAQAIRDNVDDVGFIGALIDELIAELPIDEHRVYATGHSNGALLSYRLACELSDRIAAVAVQAGTLGIDTCAPGRGVALLHVHGTDDASLPISGGRGEGVSGTDFPSPREGVRRYAAAAGCAGETLQRDTGNPDLLRRRFDGCRDGAVVEMVEVDGASHAWMGRPSTRASRLVAGEPYPDLDMSAAAWGFVSAFRRP